MAESDNILTRLQDLLVYLIPQLNKFPRDRKFVLGDSQGPATGSNRVIRSGLWGSIARACRSVGR